MYPNNPYLGQLSNSTPSPSGSPSPIPAFNPHLQEDFNLRSLLFPYISRWYWFIAVLGVFLAVAYFFNTYFPAQYRVNLKLIVDKEQDNQIGRIFPGSTLSLYKEKSNELEILRSFNLNTEALERLNVNVSYFENGIFFKEQIYGNLPVVIEADWKHPQLTNGLIKLEVLDGDEFTLDIEESWIAPNPFLIFNPNDPGEKISLKSKVNFNKTYRFGEWVNGPNFKFRVVNSFSLAGDILYFKLVDTPSLTANVISNLSVSKSSENTSILEISLITPIRRFGEEYLNTLADLFIQKQLEEKNFSSEKTITFIEAQLLSISDSLSYVEDNLQEYRSDNLIFNLSQEGNLIFQNLMTLENQKTELNFNYRFYKELKEHLQKNDLASLAIPSVSGLSDPLLNSLINTLIELESDRVKLSAIYSEATPSVQEIKRKFESTKKALLDNINFTLQTMESKIREINTGISKLESQISLLPETERKLMVMQRKFNINENIYLFLLQKRAEAQITKAANSPSSSVLDKAKFVEIVYPQTKRNYYLAFFLGLVIPASLIFLKNSLNDKIVNPKELKQKLSFPFLGSIGRSDGEDDHVVLNESSSSVTESFRSLRADMSYINPGKNSFSILFTSTVSGEGKSFMALNFATLYAITGMKTILVGLDLRRPKIYKYFPVKNDLGISNFLSQDLKIESCIKSTHVENLSVLLSGPIPPNPGELLLRPKFTELMNYLKANYEVIIMDCPPIGLVSETRELFKFSDVNLYVFRQDYSEKNNIELANLLLEKEKTAKIYGVLNDVHLFDGYGYGYSYGYGYGKKYGYYGESKKGWFRRWGKRKKKN
jgi:tyrosine-protein kinase Etk/Wzc